MEEARKMLTIYRALDNESRLKILYTILNEPDIAFNDIARKTEIDKPALAYHLGVLKNVGLVEMEYQKRSKKLTKTNSFTLLLHNFPSYLSTDVD
jgi:DNA-binding transcriptional ArsR family regulator